MEPAESLPDIDDVVDNIFRSSDNTLVNRSSDNSFDTSITGGEWIPLAESTPVKSEPQASTSTAGKVGGKRRRRRPERNSMESKVRFVMHTIWHVIDVPQFNLGAERNPIDVDRSFNDGSLLVGSAHWPATIFL